MDETREDKSLKGPLGPSPLLPAFRNLAEAQAAAWLNCRLLIDKAPAKVAIEDKSR